MREIHLRLAAKAWLEQASRRSAGAVCAEGSGKLDSLGERWPELAGLFTVDFGCNFMAAISYLTGVTLIALGVALILG